MMLDHERNIVDNVSEEPSIIEDPSGLSSNLFEIDDIQKSIMKDQKAKKNKRKRKKKKVLPPSS